MLLLSGFLEGIGGLVAFFISILILVFVISLIGRWTNTTFVVKGGSKITPFQTPKEKHLQKEEETQKREIQNEVLNRTKLLNEFCREFGKSTEKYGYFMDTMTLGTGTGDFLGILSQQAEIIEQNGNAEYVINYYLKIKLAEKTGELSADQYSDLGKEVYAKAINEVNLS